MNREDIEFWNGALKCAIKMERKARDSSTLEQVRKEISYMKQRIEDVHVSNFDRALNAIENQRVVD
ncbi:MAG: hypothetical protein M0Z77_08435 [Thermoplasmatales archaeon]|jgi:Mn-containing catalase|nr:hypothetical protein [Candidatus Thermoplasmatota archaeon]MCL6002564.1 hypothetical protein [Candidatus Thermoplasmatota archaeon]MDA8055654.1 hypothetical protein [Thermoplasmatales archaeon]